MINRYITMKTLFDFLVKFLILTVILWGVILWGAASYEIHLVSVAAAWILIAANSLAGYLLFEYAYEKPQQEFTKIVFGGLVLRLLVLMVLIALIILRSPLVLNDFVLSFFAFYCIYVIAEVLSYQKKNKQKKNIA